MATQTKLKMSAMVGNVRPARLILNADCLRKECLKVLGTEIAMAIAYDQVDKALTLVANKGCDRVH